MVSPTGFEFNAEAAQDNAFMSSADSKTMSQGPVGKPKQSCLASTVLQEFQQLHSSLSDQAGIQVPELFRLPRSVSAVTA